VEIGALDTDALFLAGTPLRVDLPRRFLIRGADDTFRLERASPQGLRYDAYSALAPGAAGSTELDLAERDRDLQLPPLDPRIPQLAHTLTAGAATPLERARAVESHLRGSHYRYTLQLPRRESADPLADFLFVRKQGHCEYFASAMAVLLRTVGIPSRMATGFESGVYNSLTDQWLVRASDAHTWVEAWLPGSGWTTFDPTPPDPNPAHFSLAMVLGLYLDAAETFWQNWVVSYDLGHQDALVDRIEQNARHAGIRWFDSFSGLGAGWGGRMAAWFRVYGLRTGIAAALGLWLWFLAPPLVRLIRMRRRVDKARRGQASIGDATLLYGRMLHVLKRHGYQKPPWFTPAEFAGSLPEGELGTAVTEFTRAYNALRFGGRLDAAPQLSALLDGLQRRAVVRR
jgi:transglutaminase-like putative cysteine protease